MHCPRFHVANVPGAVHARDGHEPLPKSQGSEFPAVVIPLATQHYLLLQRNLIYTGITRGKRLLVLIGQKKALGIAVRNDHPQRRYSGLLTKPYGKCCPL